MELLALDSSFQPIAYLPYFNLQWTREYYKIGQFSVQVAAASYDPAVVPHAGDVDRNAGGVFQASGVHRSSPTRGTWIEILCGRRSAW